MASAPPAAHPGGVKKQQWSSSFTLPLGAPLLGLALLVAQPAAGQISGSLEKLIVDLPTGCTTRSESTKPGSGGTFAFSYTCLDRHGVTFTVSLPSSVSSVPATSFHDSWYELASPANANASVSWKWTTPATVPGRGGLFNSAGLRLFLSARGVGSSCAAS